MHFKTNDTHDLIKFQNILHYIKGIYVIPQYVFDDEKGTFKATLQIDFVDENTCQIAAVDTPSGESRIKINHVCSECDSDHACNHIVQSIQLYEACSNPKGTFAKEFISNYDIPTYYIEQKEMLNKFTEPLERLLKITTIGKITIFPPWNHMQDITGNVMFSDEIPALISHEEKGIEPNVSQIEYSNLRSLILEHLCGDFIT